VDEKRFESYLLLTVRTEGQTPPVNHFFLSKRAERNLNVHSLHVYYVVYFVVKTITYNNNTEVLYTARLFAILYWKNMLSYLFIFRKSYKL
jgi:hypothetical protein